MDHTSTPPTGTMTAEEESRMVAALGEVFDLARQGDASALGALIAHGANPDARDNRGHSAADAAAYMGAGRTPTHPGGPHH